MAANIRSTSLFGLAPAPLTHGKLSGAQASEAKAFGLSSSEQPGKPNPALKRLGHYLYRRDTYYREATRPALVCLQCPN
jgi:hypothetical protein